MDEALEEALGEVKNEYRGGNPPEVVAARQVVLYLQGIEFPDERIPGATDVLYIGELYKVALEHAQRYSGEDAAQESPETD